MSSAIWSCGKALLNSLVNLIFFSIFLLISIVHYRDWWWRMMTRDCLHVPWIIIQTHYVLSSFRLWYTIGRRIKPWVSWNAVLWFTYLWLIHALFSHSWLLHSLIIHYWLIGGEIVLWVSKPLILLISLTFLIWCSEVNVVVSLRLFIRWIICSSSLLIRWNVIFFTIMWVILHWVRSIIFICC